MDAYLLTAAATLHRADPPCGLPPRDRAAATVLDPAAAVRWAREGARLCRACDQVAPWPEALTAAAGEARRKRGR